MALMMFFALKENLLDIEYYDWNESKEILNNKYINS